MKASTFRSFLAAAMAALMAAAGTAGWAQDEETDSVQSPFIQRFDQDGDGLVSADEFPRDKDWFKGLDQDGNGVIDASEAPLSPDGGKDPLAEFDADGDGQLSSDEFPGSPDHFSKLDSDGDEYLSKAELLAGRPQPPGAKGFENDDADQDGSVSQGEFSGPADLFNLLDADGDGAITRKEAQMGHGLAAGSGKDSKTDSP
jgi:Ca2+-binding EF-hand superfamily protein